MISPSAILIPSSSGELLNTTSNVPRMLFLVWMLCCCFVSARTQSIDDGSGEWYGGSIGIRLARVANEEYAKTKPGVCATGSMAIFMTDINSTIFNHIKVSNLPTTCSCKDMSILTQVATVPTAKWFGKWNGDGITNDIARYTSMAINARKIGVIVLYNIPALNCAMGQGAANLDGYKKWINKVAAGILTGRAGRNATISGSIGQLWIILEPDAIPLMSPACPASIRKDRVSALQYAIEKLGKAPISAKVYVDSGHSKWHTPADIAGRIKLLGPSFVKYATGLSFNVANYRPTDEVTAYAERVLDKLDMRSKVFVMDTSRNGALDPAPDGTWCNYDKAALGPKPEISPPEITQCPPDCRLAAYLWIKPPYESDGTCGQKGAPPAGSLYVDYVAAMAKRAGW